MALSKIGNTRIIHNFEVRLPRCVDRITNIGKMQSNATFNICIGKRYVEKPLISTNIKSCV